MEGYTRTDNRMLCKLARQALRYIVRNTTLPPRARAEAHIQLAQMHCYTNPTQIRNRCILGGKGRGIFRDFKMSRVSGFGFALVPPWQCGLVEDGIACGCVRARGRLLTVTCVCSITSGCRPWRERCLVCRRLAGRLGWACILRCWVREAHGQATGGARLERA